MLRPLLSACVCAVLVAAEPAPDVTALLDPALRAEAWSRLVEASELHGLIDGPPTAVLRAGPSRAPLLVLVPPHREMLYDRGSDNEEDQWPGLDLASILPPATRLLPPGGLGAQQLWRVTAKGDIDAIEANYYGVLADLDDDGAAELAAVRNVKLSGERWACELLIQRLDQAPSRRLFRLLCGASKRTWAIALRRPPPAAVLAVGPLEDNMVVPTFDLRWDAGRGEWLCSDERWVQRLGLEDDEAAVQAAGTRLPEAAPPAPPTLAERIARALSRAYAAQSFAGRDAAGILAWMGPGRTWPQLRQASLETPQLPAVCWNLPPAEAALVFARANRRRSNEARWPLSSGTIAPAAQGDAMLESWCRAHGRGDDCHHGFLLLHLAGAESFLVRASQYSSTGIRAGVLSRVPQQTVTIQPIPEALARQAMDVLRQLAALAGQAGPDTHRHGYSSADGAGCLILDGIQVVAGTTWAGAPGERWHGQLDDTARLNLAYLWLGQALTERLGAAWPKGFRGDAEREERDARDVLARWRAGAIPGLMAGIAASLLADRGATDLPMLLGELPPDADGRLIAARTRCLFRAAAADDQVQLLAAARQDGPEQTWAIDRLLERDPPATIAVLRELIAATSDEHQRKTWNAWLKEAETPARPRRNPAPLAGPAPTVPPRVAAPPPPGPPPVPVANENERIALLNAVQTETAEYTLRPALEAAVPRLLAGNTADRAALEAVLSDRLADTRASLRPLLLTAWAYDLRQLRPAIEAIANAGPEDAEGPRLIQSGGSRGVQLARYHLARQVLSLWDESDPTARARLLTAFALNQGIAPVVGDAAGRRLAGALAACGAWQAAVEDILAAWNRPLPAGFALGEPP